MILFSTFVILFTAMLICKNGKINRVLGEYSERRKKATKNIQKQYDKFTVG